MHGQPSKISNITESSTKSLRHPSIMACAMATSSIAKQERFLKPFLF